MKGAAQFDASLRAYFRADNGAYSEITKTEGSEKRQYNVKASQRDILEEALGDELTRRRGLGSKSSLEEKGISATSSLYLYPSGKKIEITLVYPKIDKNELRIYFSEDTFTADAFDFMVIFSRKGEVWIGAVSKISLDIIRGRPEPVTMIGQRSQTLEEELDGYQDILNQAPELVKSDQTRFAWKRNPNVARAALEKADFTCEMFPGVPTFPSKRTGKPFMEVHHLVPMKCQSDFSQNLDVIENMCVLSPNAHRLVHHATDKVLDPHLTNLFKKRKDFLTSLKVDHKSLRDLYI